MKYKRRERKGAGEEWERPTPSSIHQIEELRRFISEYIQKSDEFLEMVHHEGSPVITQMVESSGMELELTASFVDSWNVHQPNISQPDEIKELFEDLKKPAVTTEEVANRFNCSPNEAFYQLVELEHRGVVESEKSGETVLWWPREDESELPFQSLSEDSVQKGIRKSFEDIEEWVSERKRNSESMEEAYERLRGKPDPEALKKFVVADDIDTTRMMEAIEEKEEDGKDELREMFK